jgi:aromatase
MARTDNAVVIAAPLQFVWDAMNDIEAWPQLFGEYAEAIVLQRDGNTVRFRLTTHPDPEHDGAVWTWVSERTVDPDTYTTHAERVETGPFQFMHIDWAFTPVAGGTEMRWQQHFTMKPEAPADDATAREYLNRNTRIQMALIKERLERAASEAPTLAA